MKRPKGFGKNYFTLTAILAFSVEKKLQSQVSSISSLLHNTLSKDEEDLEENDPPCELLELTPAFITKASHCNCFFKLLTRLILLFNTFIPRCPFYCTYFAFRRSGVHPPLY